MRAFLCLALAAASSTCALSQTTPIPLLDQLKAQLLLSGLKQSVAINGTASWVAGGTQDSGPAKLTANVDGSTELMLGLSKSMRAETTSAFTNRTCQWIDSTGTNHELKGLSCFTPLPWFAPNVLPLILSSSGAAVRDGGELLETGLLRHQLILDLSATYVGNKVQTFAAATQMTVHYDPVTLSPASLDYNLHADGDSNRSIPVRVVFSDYRPVSGLPVPFHIERYINGTLELTIAVDTVILN